METRIIYVSRDQDCILKFWKTRPFYNESEDEFHGKYAKLTIDSLAKATFFAKRYLDPGDCVPLIVAKEGHVGPSYAQMIKDKICISEEEAVNLLVKGFRQVALSLGRKSDEKYESCYGLDVTAFRSRIIRFTHERATANEIITDIFAEKDSVEGDEYYLTFIVRTEKINQTIDDYLYIDDIIEDNANHFYDLLALLEALETNVIYEKELNPSEETKAQILACKILNCNREYIGKCNDKDVRKMCDMLQEQFGIISDAISPAFIYLYMPHGDHYAGVIYGTESGSGQFNRFQVIGKKEGVNNNIRWWIAVYKDTLVPVNTALSLYESIKAVYVPITGNKTEEPELFYGYDFFSEVVSNSEQYDEKVYRKGFEEGEDEE